VKNVRIGAEHVDLNWIQQELSQKSYWAKGRTLEEMRRVVKESRCYSIFDEAKQIGFARVVSDLTVFAYLADVWVDEGYRGEGAGAMLIEHILQDPVLSGVRRWLLATKDAQEFYRRFGFGELKRPERFMEIDLRESAPV
jgi:N-acetylglutamate synthase-like GNAT family acetyltransferase